MSNKSSAGNKSATQISSFQSIADLYRRNLTASLKKVEDDGLIGYLRARVPVHPPGITAMAEATGNVAVVDQRRYLVRESRGICVIERMDREPWPCWDTGSKPYLSADDMIRLTMRAEEDQAVYEGLMPASLIIQPDPVVEPEIVEMPPLVVPVTTGVWVSPRSVGDALNDMFLRNLDAVFNKSYYNFSMGTNVGS